jgi:hypothetical protein
MAQTCNPFSTKNTESNCIKAYLEKECADRGSQGEGVWMCVQSCRCVIILLMMTFHHHHATRWDISLNVEDALMDCMPTLVNISNLRLGVVARAKHQTCLTSTGEPSKATLPPQAECVPQFFAVYPRKQLPFMLTAEQSQWPPNLWILLISTCLLSFPPNESLFSG